MKSLKDQLLKAGLTDKQSVKNARKQSKQSKQAKKPKRERGQTSESAALAEQALRDKAVADRELNRKRQLEVEKKEQLAQIKQLVQNSKLDREEGDLAYNFTDAGKVKKIYVNQEQQKQLSLNQISIVCLDKENIELVPKVVANKIAQRDPIYIIKNETSTAETDEDDPYADYQIPDDLVW